jgi:hypothetical protein
MLKKFPKARVEIESDDDRRQRWAQQQVEALTKDELEQLKQDISFQAQQAVKDVVYEAIRATAGESGVVLLDSHASRLDELAQANDDADEDGIAATWFAAVKDELWDAIVEQETSHRFLDSGDFPALPADGSLVRLIFPEVDSDYARYEVEAQLPEEPKRFGKPTAEEWAVLSEAWAEQRIREQPQEDRNITSDEWSLLFKWWFDRCDALSDAEQAERERFVKKYDFDTFVVANSSLTSDDRGYMSDLDVLVSAGNPDAVYDSVGDCFEEQWEKAPLADEEFPPYITLHISAKQDMDVLVSRQELEAEGPPVILNDVDGETFWFYQDSIYVTEEGLEPEDVLALINEKENQKRSKLNKARDLQAMRDEDDGSKPAKAGKAGKKTRKSIPEEVRHAVWRRDEGKCVDCDSQQELEFDHIIPLAMGGSNTERNLQLLCADCNRRKGATLG